MAAPQAAVTVLIVDDNESVREMVGDILKGRGYRIVFAEDPVQGMVLAKRELPRLAVFDFQMPGGDGGSLYENFRNTPEGSEIPVLFISGSIAMDDARMQAILGRDRRTRFLRKPFAVADLLELVDALLPAKPSKRGARRP
jgi:CheY-like chemotaxis protein